MKPKIIAMYLPQYHEFEENNMWWGKGHTEWISCKKAKPLFSKQYQPRVPLNNNYYDLSTTDEQIIQAEIAKEYGIYGFCYYHYWFEGKKLMELPLENMLKDKRVDLPFCVSWANHTWTNSTKKTESNILIRQTYGEKEDWIKHFYYLLDFFTDDRYIKIDGKPMLVIYDAKDIKCWEEMKKTWDELCIKEGVSGIFYVSTLKHEIDIKETKKMKFDAQFEYQPTYALSKGKKLNFAFFYNLKRIICKDFLGIPCKIRYESVWKKVLKSNHEGEITTFLGAYNDWDTTARWNKYGIVHKGANPDKFCEFFKKQIARSEKEKNEFLFFTAWNEWSEGAYLEADEKYKYGYLEKIKECLGITKNED